MNWIDYKEQKPPINTWVIIAYKRDDKLLYDVGKLEALRPNSSYDDWDTMSDLGKYEDILCWSLITDCKWH